MLIEQRERRPAHLPARPCALDQGSDRSAHVVVSHSKTGQTVYRVGCIRSGLIRSFTASTKSLSCQTRSWESPATLQDCSVRVRARSLSAQTLLKVRDFDGQASLWSLATSSYIPPRVWEVPTLQSSESCTTLAIVMVLQMMSHGTNHMRRSNGRRIKIRMTPEPGGSCSPASRRKRFGHPGNSGRRGWWGCQPSLLGGDRDSLNPKYAQPKNPFVVINSLN